MSNVISFKFSISLDFNDLENFVYLKNSLFKFIFFLILAVDPAVFNSK